ncbi:hypothetical protein ACHAXR_013163 [Thalassiosira sp. AJA248-18]
MSKLLTATETTVGVASPSSFLSTGLPDAQSILPKRIITVFGAESSGSTFLATALGIASGAFPPNGTHVTLPSDRHNNPGRTIVERVVARRARSPDGSIEMQHLSLPWGYWGTKKRNCDLANRTITIEAFVPEPCFRFDYESTWPHRLEVKAPAGCREEAHISGRNSATNRWTCGTNNCGQDENDGYALYPRRFFVNITSHVEWYLQRGVDITAVLSVRDRSISLAGKEKMHCGDETIAMQEEEKARAIMTDSLKNYGRLGRLKDSGISHDNSNDERVIVVSYEALMSMRESYLFDTYKKLGIMSTFIPDFKDGNEKYIQTKK